MGNSKKFIKYYLFVSAIYSASLGIWAGTIYLFMNSIGYSVTDINIFLIMFWITSFIFEIPSGILGDNFGYLKICRWSSIIRAIGLLFILFSKNSIYLLIIGGVLAGIGCSLYSGAFDTWIINLINDEKNSNSKLIDDVISKQQTISGIISLIIGYVGAQLLSKIGLGLPILIGAVLLLISYFLFSYIDRQYTCDDYKKIDKKNISKKIFLTLSDDVRNSIQKIDFQFLTISIILLSICFVTTMPYNQWQLFFENSMKKNMGILLVGINISGILGSYLGGKISFNRKSLFKFSILFLLINFLVLESVFVSNKFISIIFFLFHCLLTSFYELKAYTFIQKFISDENRNTMISMYNFFESFLIILVMIIDYFILKFFHVSIGLAWSILSIIGILVFGGFLFILKNKK